MSTGRTLLARALTALLALAAAAVVVVAVVNLDGVIAHSSPWWYLSIPVIVVTSSVPLYLMRYDAWLFVGLESSVLLFLMLSAPWPLALLLWAVGVTACQFYPLNARAKVFNASVDIISGAAAVGLFHLLAPSPGVSVQEVLAIAVAFTAYYVINVGISIIRLDLSARRGAPVLDIVGEVLSLFAIFMAVNVMGYLAAILYRGQPAWTIVLLAAPASVVLIAVRGITQERETARRLSALFETARALHAARSSEEILEEMRRGIVLFGKTQGASLRKTPPGRGEVGRPFVADDDVFWLVLERGRSPRASALPQTEALSSIVQQGEEALSRMRMHRELTFNAEHDSLTTLTNRAVFLSRLEAALESERVTGAGTCAVLFCDLDGFKKVNDQFGHQAGDDALIRIARRLDDAVPRGVVVARLGGDEFALLTSRTAASIRVDELTDRVREVVAQPFEFDDYPVVMSVSIGVAYAGGADSAEEFLRNADIAMYEAKRRGRDAVVEYDPSMGQARVRSLEMVDRLRSAIERRDLRAVYQPITSAGSGEVLCLEALARWTSNGEVIPPSDFIPIAEDANLIEDLGTLILEQVCEDTAMLTAALGPSVAIAVNISARQLRSEAFLAAVGRATIALGEHPLTLEITETEAISDEVIETRVMDTLIAQGVSFAVDDFGIGFSSMEYLMRLPVRTLKMDRIFSRSIDEDPRSADLLASMLSVGHALGLDVVVEGIERSAQLDKLAQITAPGRFEALCLQGYLLGAPMSPPSLLNWARHRATSATTLRQV